MRGVGIGAHMEGAELVRPLHDGCKVAGNLRFDGREGFAVDVAGRTVEGDPVSFFEGLAGRERQGLVLLRDRGFRRITSYNVCYTKLLRWKKCSSLWWKCFSYRTTSCSFANHRQRCCRAANPRDRRNCCFRRQAASRASLRRARSRRCCFRHRRVVSLV